MQGFTVDLDELHQARKVILEEATHFGQIRDTVNDGSLGTSPLGTRPAAVTLTRLCRDIEVAVVTQLWAAEHFLDQIGLGLARQHVRLSQSEHANVDVLRRGPRVTPALPFNEMIARTDNTHGMPFQEAVIPAESGGSTPNPDRQVWWRVATP